MPRTEEKKKIKLIASDLDGTLLQHSARNCNEELFPIIEQLCEKGVYFIPASGRQYPCMQNMFAPVKDKIMYLCENGALVMHSDKVLVKKQFEDTLALKICHAVLDEPDCEVLISGEQTSYMIPKTDAFLTYIRDDLGNHVSVIEQPEQIKEPILKIAYFVTEERRDEVTAAFSKKFGDKSLIMTSGNRWVDFAPLGTNKGTALQAIGERLHISPDEMVAFGDNETDRAMLTYVGHPYLMENCNPTMRDIKAVNCKKVEDSLKEILEKL